jgi:hypothetical protein
MLELAPRALTVQQEAQGELDAKQGMDKLKAVRDVALLVKQAQGEVPEAMKKCIKEVEEEVNEIKELQAALQAEGELDLVAADGKKCNEAKIFTPVECYRHIYGSVTETRRGIPRPKNAKPEVGQPPSPVEAPPVSHKEPTSTKHETTPAATGGAAPASGSSHTTHEPVKVDDADKPQVSPVKVEAALFEAEDHNYETEEDYAHHDDYYHSGKQVPMETTLSLLMLKKAVPFNLYLSHSS